MMDSRTVILLATQRSGTHALRSVLDSHPQIRDLGEVFTIGKPEPGLFEFLAERASDDPTWVLPWRREALFLEYLGTVTTASPQPIVVMDVKYNQTHHLDGSERWPDEPPAFFGICRRMGLPILHLVRENVVRVAVSGMRANETGRFHLERRWNLPAPEPIRIAPGDLLHRLRVLTREARAVREALARRDDVLEVRYESLLITEPHDPPGAFNRSELSRIADWLGVEPTFDLVPPLHRFGSDRLADDVANYDEIATALQGTEYERFLD